jgi:Flp pilus assembly protein CpaB
MTYRIRNVLIAVGLAFVAMLLTLYYVTNYKRSVQRAQTNVQVYVAAHDIPAGTAGSDIVKAGDLRVVKVQRHDVVPGAISSPTQIAPLVLTDPIYSGEQVTLRPFADAAAEGIRAKLKGTLRAVQVAGDPNQLLAGTLQTGDHVDLVGNLRLGPNTTATATRIVLRDLTVLSTQSSDSSSGGLSKPSTSGGSGSSSVILAVSDTQVQRLFFVVQNGDWTLELRPVVDATDSPDRVDTLSTVLNGGLR